MAYKGGVELTNGFSDCLKQNYIFFYKTDAQVPKIHRLLFFLLRQYLNYFNLSHTI